MSLSADQFAKAVVNAGLSSAEEIKTLWNALPAGTRPKDGETFAKLLIEREKLTQFQVSELLSGSTTPLVLGDYVLLAKIGAGGMGQVFKAHHRRMKRMVAIKLLPTSLTKDEAAIKRFEREVEAAAKLSHPNIVAAYDARVERGTWYLVMEYVEGHDLAEVCKQGGMLPVADVLNYITQAARGLAFAHGKGVVHRDIKPANLLLDNEGVVKILDMGLARIDGVATAAQEGLTQSGQVMGTVDYMAPEQAFDTRSADARADIYSLGCTLYRLLTGQNIYDGETMVQKLMAHQTKPIPSILKRRPDVPQELEAIYERMVAKSPADRFQTMAEVEAALVAIASPSPQSPAYSPPEADSKLNAFFRSITGHLQAGNPMPKSVATLPTGGTNAAPVDGTAPTMSLQRPLQETDPVSERSIQLVRQGAPHPTAKQPPSWRQPRVLIAAGASALLLLVALGVWVIIRNPEGKEVARIKVPEGGSVEVRTNGEAQSRPTATESTNYALEFDGQASYVEVPSLSYSGAGGITIEAFLKAATTDQANGRPISLSGPSGGSFVCIEQKNTLWQACAGVAQSRDYVTSSNTIQVGQRSHVAFVWDGSQSLALFVDGKRQKSEVGKTSRNANRQSFMIGADLGQAMKVINGFAGIIDEVRVSKGTRYGEDVTPPNRYQPDADTLALYHFDEGTGDVLKDSSGNNHHGKVTGAKWVRVDGSAIFASNDPKFQKWAKEVAAMPAEKQLAAFSQKLMELNPGFDGKLEHSTIENGNVIEVSIRTHAVTNISPVRALPKLKSLTCDGIGGTGILRDLTPLTGMKLTSLGVQGTQVSDLEPLRGMPLESLTVYDTPLFDLSPLFDCKNLISLGVRVTKVTAAGVAKLQQALPKCQIQWDGEKSPFVTLRSGAAAARHATLEEALAASQPQDVIEVHGNGPFPIGVSKSVLFQQKEFTLKAAAGFRPLFVAAPSGAEKTNTNMFNFNGGTVRFEDIDIASARERLFGFDGVRDVAFLRCRFVTTSKVWGGMLNWDGVIEQRVSLSDCCILSAHTAGAALSFGGGPARIEMTNTLLFTDASAVSLDAIGHSLRMNRCTVVTGQATQWNALRDLSRRRGRGTAEPSRCLILGPAINLSQPLNLTEEIRWQGKENVYGLSKDGHSTLNLPNNVKLPFDEWVNSPAKPETGSKLVPTKAKSVNEFLDPDPAVMFRKLKTYLEELRTLHPDVGADPAVADPGLVPLATAPPILSLNDPAFQQWMKDVAAQPADQQVAAVAKKLQDLNPDFDGMVTHSLKNGAVFELSFSAEHVSDISPVRALTGLKSFGCRSTRKSKFANLSPLQGLSLTTITLESTSVSDLSPLQGMPLTSLNFGATLVSDLSPLQGMPLSDLVFYGTLVPDLSAVKDLKLKKITIGAKVSDLSPLKGMPLTGVNCASSQVSDLSPLRGMALTSMDCQNTKVTDLKPLKGMPLTNLHCDFVPERDTEILRSFKTLTSINYKTAAEFWKTVESPPPVKKP